MDRTNRRPPPLTRLVLPSLISLRFKGASEFLEELVSRINIPSLEDFSVTFFNQVMFDISQLPQLIRRTNKYKFKALNRARITFSGISVKVRLADSEERSWARPAEKRTSNRGTLDFDLEILCTEPDWQLSSLAQVYSSFSHHLSTLEDLRIDRDWLIPWPDDIESTQ